MSDRASGITSQDLDVGTQHAKLSRDSLDASDSELVLPANPLEQLHLRSPLHPGLLPLMHDAPVNRE